VEADPNGFWKAFLRVVLTIAGRTHHDPIEALAMSCHGETFVPADEEGNPVGDAIMNADNRAIAEADELAGRMGWESIYNLTGAPPHAMFPLAKIAWLRQNRPGIFVRARSHLCVGDYILRRMGLPPAIDPSQASRTQLFDIHARAWSEPLCEAIGIQPDMLPEVLPAGALLGRLNAGMASDLGLPARTRVAVGGHDQPCGALGLGVIKPGVVGDSAGSYECLTVSSSQPNLNRTAMDSRLNSYCHVAPGQYVTLAFFPSGLMMRWFAESLCGVTGEDEAGPFFAQLEAEARGNPSGLIVLPHVVGACNPKWDARATAGIAGLTLRTSRALIYRGILEGLAAELALNTNILALLTQCPFDEIRIFGGGAKSALGLELRASSTGRAMRELQTGEASCLGAAMLAGLGAGVFKNPDEAVARLAHFGDAIPPDAALGKWFAGYRTKVLKFYDALKDLRGEE
jgi:xylulokinase